MAEGTLIVKAFLILPFTGLPISGQPHRAGKGSVEKAVGARKLFLESEKLMCRLDSLEL